MDVDRAARDINIATARWSEQSGDFGAEYHQGCRFRFAINRDHASTPIHPYGQMRGPLRKD